jgi:hypothetical protein
MSSTARIPSRPPQSCCDVGKRAHARTTYRQVAFAALRNTEPVSIFSVGIKIWSESLTVDEISALAGTQPTRSHAKGERLSLRLPATKVWPGTLWVHEKAIRHDTWTLDPHWPFIALILESLATHDRGDLHVTLSIGTNARPSGYAFDIEPDKMALLASAGCGVWIDTYQGNWIQSDRPDDYPFEGTSLALGALGRARRRFNERVRAINPFGKVRRHGTKSGAGLP